MNHHAVGAFSRNDIKTILASGRIIALPGFSEEHINPASLDLTVSNGEAYRIDRFILPSFLRQEKIRTLLPHMGAHQISFGAVMEPGAKYLLKATINVAFPPGLYAYCNAKSTSGRNFILSRVVADQVGQYDSLDQRKKGWEGEVWLLIEPLVYPVILTDKECYAQMRFFDGDTRFKEQDLTRELLSHDFLFRQDGGKYQQGDLRLITEDGSVMTTLFAKAGKLVGFRLKKTRTALLLTERRVDPKDYFEPVYAENDPTDPSGGMIVTDPLSYYLLSTNEMVNVPVHLCAELVALDVRLGLFFSHFAGFFDPGFVGVPTLEVASFTQMTLRHRQPIGRFRYERMRSVTDSYANIGNYAGQKRTTLPKQFQMPEVWAREMVVNGIR